MIGMIRIIIILASCSSCSVSVIIEVCDVESCMSYLVMFKSLLYIR